MEFRFSEEQIMFKEQVVKFATKEILPRVEEHDYKESFDFESFRKMGEYGILGLHFPEEYGGSSASLVTTCLAGEALGEAGVDGGLCIAYGSHSFLNADTILTYGTEKQKNKYLPKLASGEWIGAMGLTEPGAGSDNASMRTTAIKKGDRYILNGNKMFITNGPIADVLVVYAKTQPKLKHTGISAFIVEKGTKGFSTGKPLKKMGVHSSQTSELIFEDCEIPEENLLGQENNGFFMAMHIVDWDHTAILAPTIGVMTYMIKKCAQYAKNRVQFGKPIASYQAIKHKLADMILFREALWGLVYRTAWHKDMGQPVNIVEGAIAKLFCGDWSLRPMHAAVTLMGGYGFCHEYEMERYFRDSILGSVGGGTSEIQKIVISKFM